MRVFYSIRNYLANLSKNERTLICVIFVVLFLFGLVNSIFDFVSLNIDSGTFLSVVSIFIGFNITVLSIMALADYSKDLYRKEIKTSNGVTTLFHKLISYYKGQIYFSLLILLFLIIVVVFSISCKYIDNVMVFLLGLWFITSIYTLKYTFAFIIKQVGTFK